MSADRAREFGWAANACRLAVLALACALAANATAIWIRGTDSSARADIYKRGLRAGLAANVWHAAQMSVASCPEAAPMLDRLADIMRERNESGFDPDASVDALMAYIGAIGDRPPRERTAVLMAAAGLINGIASLETVTVFPDARLAGVGRECSLLMADALRMGITGESLHQTKLFISP